MLAKIWVSEPKHGEEGVCGVGGVTQCEVSESSPIQTLRPSMWVGEGWEVSNMGCPISSGLGGHLHKVGMAVEMIVWLLTGGLIS